MINKIPIQFEYEGKHYEGNFTSCFAAGGNVWHLMIDNYFYGQLIHSEPFGWAFYNNEGSMKELSEYFGEYITLWYQ